MRLLITFTRTYPLRSTIMVLALLFAGFMEGIGLTMLLPLVGIAVNHQSDARASQGTGGVASDSALERIVADVFENLGLSPSVGVLLSLIIATVILKSALMLLAKKQVGYTVARVATDLRLELLRALLVSRWQYFVRQSLGSLANSMATEAARASKAYLSGVMMTSEFIQALIYCLTAFLISWKATLIALAAGFTILFGLKHFLTKARRAGVRQTDLLKSLLALLMDTLQSIKPLKAMSREDVSDFLLEKKTYRLNKALQKQVLNKEFLRAFQETLLTIFLAGGLYTFLIFWQMPLASVLVLAFLIARLLKSLSKVQERYQELLIFESAYWSLKDTVNSVKGEREELSGSEAPEFHRAVRLNRVNFAYEDHPVLRDVSLIFPAGQITVIVGPSGSGKTTIVDLITGLLRPQAGEVFIDDKPLSQTDLRKWRRMVGYVPQETILLHDSILNNITLGDPELTDADVKKALSAAGAWDFVSSRPLEMQSTVGERGGKLSGGQRQRIAIARALVHKPRLLILDEATSALDPQSEADICETLWSLRGELTILAISHQTALVKIADQAYRIQDGEVVPAETSSEHGIKTNEINREKAGKLKMVLNPGKVL